MRRSGPAPLRSAECASAALSTARGRAVGWVLVAGGVHARGGSRGSRLFGPWEVGPIVIEQPDERRAAPVSDASPAMPTSGLSLSGIVKSYGAVQALRGANLACTPGRVHGLVGENGAGKSTLVKILSGLWPPTPAMSGSTERRCAFTRRTRLAKAVSARFFRSSA